MNAAAPHIPPAEIMYADWNLLTQDASPAKAFKGVLQSQERFAGTLERAAAGQVLTAAQKRKARYLERRNALQFAIEVKLIALGFGVLTAAKVAALALKLNWQRARDEMERAGYSYFDMKWIKGKTA